ncbi:MAG: hypothetical protein R3E93_05755 [Thiothrix sp.]
MKRRFRPLAEITGEGGTGWNQGGTQVEPLNPLKSKGGTVEPVEPRFFAGCEVKNGGVAAATRGCFRAAEYQDITHEQAGMVQCGECGHGLAMGKSEPGGLAVIRCRHPDVHGGLWPVLGQPVAQVQGVSERQGNQATTYSGGGRSAE